VSNDCDNIILLGDFNFKCNDHSTGYNKMKPLLDDYELGWCNNFDLSNIAYIYFQDSLGRYSFNRPYVCKPFFTV